MRLSGAIASAAMIDGGSEFGPDLEFMKVADLTSGLVYRVAARIWRPIALPSSRRVGEILHEVARLGSGFAPRRGFQ